jgi:hypothetical protein
MKDPRKVGNSRMQKSIYTCFYSLLICVLSQQANAQEYCVTCTGPEAIYRCIVDGEATVEARSARGQFLCIKELAKSGRQIYTTSHTLSLHDALPIFLICVLSQQANAQEYCVTCTGA